MPKQHDLIIRWNDQKASLTRLKLSGSVPIHGYPNHLRCPGGAVAIVARNNGIVLIFKVATIEGPQRVTLANGKSRPNGYVIRADRKTLQLVRPPVDAPVRRWHAIGQFRYFDVASMRSRLVGNTIPSNDEYIEDAVDQTSAVVFRPHILGIPGIPRNHPEATLVNEYVAWMGVSARFGHNYIREAKLFVDLFDLTHWQLLEAKATPSRDAIRMAIGQLRDYKRFYLGRHPSLAALLPSRPDRHCVKLLHDNRIAVIWRNPRGNFTVTRWQDQTA